MKYVISYDLDLPGKDYTALLNELRRLGATRILLSQWLLNSPNTASQLRDHFRQYIDANDRLLVNPLGAWASWNLMADPNAL